MANDKYPNKPLADWIPRSMRDSGVNLDPECYPGGTEGIPQAEAGASELTSSLPTADAGEGLDAAMRKLAQGGN